MNQQPQQIVQAQVPVLVFLFGQLVPRAAVRIEASPIEPTTCKITIISDHPAMPPGLTDWIEPIVAAAKAGQPIPMDTVRCIAALPGANGAPVMIETVVRQVAFAEVNPQSRGEA